MVFVPDTKRWDRSCAGLRVTFCRQLDTVPAFYSHVQDVQHDPPTRPPCLPSHPTCSGHPTGARKGTALPPLPSILLSRCER